MSIKLIPARPSDRLLNRRDSSQLLESQRHMGHTGVHFLMLAVFIEQKLRRLFSPLSATLGLGGEDFYLCRARAVSVSLVALSIPFPMGR